MKKLVLFLVCALALVCLCAGALADVAIDDAHFPEGTELVVSEIRSDVKDKEEAEAYQAYYETALAEVQKTQGEQKVFTHR